MEEIDIAPSSVLGVAEEVRWLLQVWAGAVEVSALLVWRAAVAAEVFAKVPSQVAEVVTEEGFASVAAAGVQVAAVVDIEPAAPWQTLLGGPRGGR